MNILFDFISIQGYYNGGAEYTYRIFQRLQKRLSDKDNLYLLYDSKLEILDYAKSDYAKYNSIDINLPSSSSLNKIISDYRIDVFFIAIMQRYIKYSIESLKCRTIVVIHDIGDVEYYWNKYHYLLATDIKEKIKVFLDFMFHRFYTNYFIIKRYSLFFSCLKNPNIHLVTVSDNTLRLLKFFFYNQKLDSVKVLYNPLESLVEAKPLTPHGLENCNQKLFVVYNVDRNNKNTKMALNVLLKIIDEYADCALVTTGKIKSIHKRHYNFKFLTSSENEWIIRHCYALVYPSLAEGFGLPPIFALKNDKIVFSSNVAPMNEILGDSVIYFNPLSECDLYSKIKDQMCKSHIITTPRSDRYNYLLKKGSEDSDKLINFILSID